MRTPLILLLLSLTCAGASVALTGPNLTLALAVSLLAALAALLLLGRAFLFRPAPPARIPRRPRAKGPHAVIDGSNVMHWNGEVPNLDTLREVIAALRAKGFQPGVVFDANAGYKFRDHYLDDRHFAKLLNLSNERVLVVA